MAWTAIREALLLLALAPFAYYLLAIVAAKKFFHRNQSSSLDFAPPVSILKPIFGLDRGAYENYASFCVQDYPEFEIIFCVTDESDPAVEVIEKIIRDFPERSIRLLVGAEPLGVSDKVNKLCRMVREARREIIVISDSDVRVEPGYLRAVVAPFRDSKIGAVTCLYRGVTDGSLAADLEALGNSTDFAPGVLAAWLLGDVDFLLGATMATTKKHVAEIGGFESLVDYFSDDYELGNRIAARGYRVELINFPVSIVYPRQRLRDAFRHQIRWNLSIRCSRPWGHLGMIFSFGLPWTLLAVSLARSELTIAAYVGAYALLRGELALTVGARGMRDSLVRKKPWLLGLRDAFAFIVWVASFFPQRIHWRGKEFYIRDKRLVPIRERAARG
ncbi:MAG: bacteriohopanetetrol glucosamine biosynthesis glycosyltransferase HpnI [Candidatus Acidiferrales bacterium]